MRTEVAIFSGIVIGVAAAGIGYVAIERPESLKRLGDAVTVDGTQRQSPATTSRVDVRSKQSEPPSKPPRVMPVTPDYGPVAEAARPIYRCTSRGGTVYSNEPCVGATVIAADDGVAGYDSRPSDRLARLVAEGRTADAGGPPIVAQSNVPRVRETVECATLRRQIVDIDAATLRPGSRESLDEWRRIRQDIRTSMARSHC